jgi:hypothetical protein
LPGSTRAVFPTKKASSFISDEEWHTTRLLVAGKPAYVWTSGIEGDEKDVVLVELGPADTLVVHADWKTRFVNGAPTCAERLLIAGVMESVTLQP